MEASIPRLEDHLPTLFEFVRTLARHIEAGKLRDGDELVRRLHDFYTADRTAAIERVAPGWTDMAAGADGATRNHISQALVALQLLPEYRQAPQHLQHMMEWTVLYHDLGKQVIAGQRDALHVDRHRLRVALKHGADMPLKPGHGLKRQASGQLEHASAAGRKPVLAHGVAPALPPALPPLEAVLPLAAALLSRAREAIRASRPSFCTRAA